MSMAVPLYTYRSTEVNMQNFINSHNASAILGMSSTPDTFAADSRFLLQGPVGNFFSTGVQRILFQDSIDALSSRCAAVIDAISDEKNLSPMLVGALPFERSSSCWLYQPKTQSFAMPKDLMSLDPSLHGATPTDAPLSLCMEPHRDVYQEMVRQAIIKLRQTYNGSRELRKVVLARSLTVDRGIPFDIGRLLRRLMEDPSVTTYCLPLPTCTTDDSPRYLTGATPELLISRRGSRIASHPLAGSMPRHHQSELDHNAADRLMQSDKDRVEHQVVVEFIADLLNPLCSDLCVPATPSLRATRSMWHLGTHMTGTLKHPDDMNISSSLAIAAQLQPTPALCGSPRGPALELIRHLESFERGFYGGAVGWTDSMGNGDWHVAIRCAEVRSTKARLYAGAGVMHDSDPLCEANETAAKFNAMIHALELEKAFDNSPLRPL